MLALMVLERLRGLSDVLAVCAYNDLCFGQVVSASVILAQNLLAILRVFAQRIDTSVVTHHAQLDPAQVYCSRNVTKTAYAANYTLQLITKLIH